MEITRGKIQKGVKFLVYGPEGIGKSTFVSHVPGVVFIDTEGSTGELDVSRLPAPSSWNMLLDEIRYAASHREEIPALVIDTGDWAERLCNDYVCETHLINGSPMKSIEDAGYGKGYVYLYEEFGKLLNLMQQMSENGQHVGFTAHAMMRKFEQPDELGAYDRWELKMSKKVAPLVKEWASLMLFVNYETMVYAADKEGKKHKAAGGQRVMYASHHPCWDAKNRYGLPDKMPFNFNEIAKIFVPIVASKEVTPSPAPVLDPPPPQVVVSTRSTVPPVEAEPDELPLVSVPESKPAIAKDSAPIEAVEEDAYKGVPKALADLMKQDNVKPEEVKAAVAGRGYFPFETPFENYPQDFVQGVLIGAWPQVRDMVFKARGELPF